MNFHKRPYFRDNNIPFREDIDYNLRNFNYPRFNIPYINHPNHFSNFQKHRFYLPGYKYNQNHYYRHDFRQHDCFRYIPDQFLKMNNTYRNYHNLQSNFSPDFQPVLPLTDRRRSNDFQ